MAFSKMQLDYLSNCNHRWNIKTGATGSGKSYLDYAAVIGKRILATRGEGLIFLIGYTNGTLERNILQPMREIWGADLVGNIKTGPQGAHAQIFGRDCMITGADKVNQVARIQGTTIEYAYGDEVATWHPDFFAMLQSRLRCQHSHFDGTCNPADPNHWLKKFIDSDADIYCQSYTLDDNPFLPPEFVESIKAEYAGTVYYNRYVLGQWAAAEGLVYPRFADDPASFMMTEQPDARKLIRICVGVDFGGNGSKHAFVATGFTPKGVIVLSSARTEPGDVDRLVHDFLLFCETVWQTYGKLDSIYCDSAEQVLIKQLIAEARRSELPWIADAIHNARKSEINDRIRLTSILIGGNRLHYTEQAKSYRDATATALWSGKHTGIDERLDDGTSDIDTLDAFEYTIERYKGELLRR